MLDDLVELTQLSSGQPQLLGAGDGVHVLGTLGPTIVAVTAGCWSVHAIASLGSVVPCRAPTGEPVASAT